MLEALARLEPPRSLLPEVRAFLETVTRRGSVPRRGARPRPCAPPACGAARRAAPRRNPLADDDRGVAQAQRDPRLVRDRGRLPTAPGPAARRDRVAAARRRARRMGARVDPGGAGRRDALAARHPALARAADVGRPHRARCAAGADRARRLHRQPLPPERVRHDRLRLLPASSDGAAGRRPSRPLRRRAHRGRGPRARASTSSGTSPPRSGRDGRLRGSRGRLDPVRTSGGPRRLLAVPRRVLRPSPARTGPRARGRLRRGTRRTGPRGPRLRRHGARRRALARRGCRRRGLAARVRRRRRGGASLRRRVPSTLSSRTTA